MRHLTWAEIAVALLEGALVVVVVTGLVLAVLRRLGVDLRAVAADEAAATEPPPPVQPPRTFRPVSLDELVARANAIHGYPTAGGYPIPDLPVIPGREEP